MESRAGYDILMKKPNSPASWLVSARTDLAAEYDALHQPDEATKFRIAQPAPTGGK